MNFLEYRTAEELHRKTGLTVEDALKIIDVEIEKINELKAREENGMQRK